MKRKQFIKSLALLPLTGTVMKMNTLNSFAGSLSSTEKMPVLFLGHGSPMNAIEENEFVMHFRELGKKLPKPAAIICVSAHWETKGTYITAMEKPRTIHDFGGFPPALYEVQYPAPGSPELAEETKSLIRSTEVGLDDKWGLDHGAWSVIKHLYPDADIPVLEISLDYYKKPEAHYELARELSALRRKGVLIIGSGNIVHNLRMVAWNKLDTIGYGYDWAEEARNKMKDLIMKGDHRSLIDYRSNGKAFELSIPTPEHYLPMLYALALQEKNEMVSLFNDQSVGGSLAMTSLRIS